MCVDSTAYKTKAMKLRVDLTRPHPTIINKTTADDMTGQNAHIARRAAQEISVPRT